MITFAVEGGIANQMRSLRIDPTGEAQVDVNGRRARGEVGTSRFTQIVAALESSGLFDDDRTYSAPPGAADLQRYEVTYAGAAVVAYDTTVPPELNEAIRLLDETLREVQQQ